MTLYTCFFPAHRQLSRAAWALRFFAACTALGACAASGCSSTAASADACNAVEGVRCRYLGCFSGDGAFTARASEGTCIAAAKDACLSGTVAGITPSADKQTACVEAIDAAGKLGNCEPVRTPSILAECSFLSAAATADAGHD